MYEEDFSNDYGGFVSFDDDLCLYQSFDNELPDFSSGFGDDDDF